MASVNKLILVGNLGKDPESNFTPSGLQITKFSVATTDSKKVGDEWENETEWHNCVAFSKLAEYVIEHLKVGDQVYIEGKLKTSSWDDANGQKKYKTDVLCNQIKVLNKKEK